MQKNLISVSQFCHTNNTSVEFFPSYFVVKDLTTGATLARGRNRNNVYEWPTIWESASGSKIAYVGVKVSLDNWHNRLGHPSTKILSHLVSNKTLPMSLSQSKSNVFCDSCHCTKSHKLPFGVSTLKSRGLLDLVYSDVWGPSPIKSMDGFSYYVLFVDHFTKNCWLFPMAKKSDVFSIFAKFKMLSPSTQMVVVNIKV